MIQRTFEIGQRLRLDGQSQYATVDDARPASDGWRLYLLQDTGEITRCDLTNEQAARVTVLSPDGGGSPHRLLAALWTEWMRAATLDAKATALATSPLRPYAHQTDAVYGAMLPQPRLRFLLADEPGTGKTVMAGLYLREMQRLGLVRRGLVVVPAHLVTKWQADFERFFGGGLRRIQVATIQEGGLESAHDIWIVSLELAAVNPIVQEALRPDHAGWDVVVFDEAHRLTPTAQALWRVGKLLTTGTPRALLMTATPHRGKDFLFRSLMHLVDPEVFDAPNPRDTNDAERLIKPSRVHFLRRMKEDLVDYDGTTRLFKGRHAQNEAIALGSFEVAFYTEALRMVDRFFPANAVPLARMVYGKRAASSLYALRETLKRRRDSMDTALPTAAAYEADPDNEDVTVQDEARIVHEVSRASKAEKSELADLIERLGKTLNDPQYVPSKWPRLTDACLAVNGIRPGNGEQAVIFTEYADTASWLVTQLRQAGFSAKRYSGRDDHRERDDIRRRFALREFQVLVSTDAGNEGIDLQTAHVLINWDIPWSLVRLEQRMGRIHRVGQTRDVMLFNLVATDTREGAVLQVLLDNFVIAANRLSGKVFDSLSAVAERVGIDLEHMLQQTYGEDDSQEAVMLAAQAITAARIEAAAREAAEEQEVLRSTVDIAAAVAALQRETLERINPKIVEAFLARLTLTGFVQMMPHAAGDGLFQLVRTDGKPLPLELRATFSPSGASAALVASSGAALAAALEGGVQLDHAVSLGPSEAAFRALVADLQGDLRPDLFQGGTLVDPTSATGYDLFVYEAPTSESGGRRTTLWPFLLRVDDTGARPVRWELLANLRVPDNLVMAAPPHPARDSDAEAQAQTLTRKEEQRRQAAIAGWLSAAEGELQRLPSAISSAISDAHRRQATRERLRRAVEARLTELKTIANVVIGQPKRVGWTRVLAAGPPEIATEADSEIIAVKHVAALLRGDGWNVADVQTEGRGYDLHATKGRKQRCVEVKGVWQSAASSGIRLTGNEVLMARQFGSEYCLYVIDHCEHRAGTLFGIFEDPATLFGDLVRDVTVYQVSGSALSAAQQAVSIKVKQSTL